MVNKEARFIQRSYGMSGGGTASGGDDVVAVIQDKKAGGWEGLPF